MRSGSNEQEKARSFGDKRGIALDKPETCPSCRESVPLIEVKNPYIRQFFRKLCRRCMLDEIERCD